MQCEGIIAETVVQIRVDHVESAPAQWAPNPKDPEGEPVLVATAQYEAVPVTQTVPEHPCEAQATMLARSVKQALCSFQEPHWVQDGPDCGYCAACFKPGTVTDLDGNVSLHPAMAIDEREGA